MYVLQILYAMEGENRKPEEGPSDGMGNERTDMISYKGHDFLPLTFRTPTSCDSCHKPVWHVLHPPAALECKRKCVRVGKLGWLSGWAWVWFGKEAECVCVCVCSATDACSRERVSIDVFVPACMHVCVCVAWRREGVEGWVEWVNAGMCIIICVLENWHHLL